MTEKITIERAVVGMAFKALDWFVNKEMTLGQRYTNGGQAALDALNALREALKQPKTEHRPITDDNGQPLCPRTNSLKSIVTGCFSMTNTRSVTWRVMSSAFKNCGTIS